jgi:phosphatidylserine/phosphatidylglycerophosphate/cardiolipin synthase-like enzyme
VIELLDYRTLNQRVVHELIPRAKEFVWLATANLKDMYVDCGAARFRSVLSVFSELAGRGVTIRILHASEPSQAFQQSIQRYKNLQDDAIELALCPRVHMKLVIVDGLAAYAGSANITGAGLGEKALRNRNFEVGWITDEQATVAHLMQLFDDVWRGAQCRACGRRKVCPLPLDKP